MVGVVVQMAAISWCPGLALLHFLEVTSFSLPTSSLLSASSSSLLSWSYGDINSEVILAQIPSESPRQFFISPYSLITAIVQFEIFLSQLKVSVSISISLTFQTSFAASFMNNWYKLMQTSSSMMFCCQIVLSLPTP